MALWHSSVAHGQISRGLGWIALHLDSSVIGSQDTSGGNKNGHHGHLPQVFVDKAQTNRQSKQKPQQPSMDDLGIAWNYDSNWVVTCCNMLTAPILI